MNDANEIDAENYDIDDGFFRDVLPVIYETHPKGNTVFQLEGIVVLNQ